MEHISCFLVRIQWMRQQNYKSHEPVRDPYHVGIRLLDGCHHVRIHKSMKQYGMWATPMHAWVPSSMLHSWLLKAPPHLSPHSWLMHVYVYIFAGFNDVSVSVHAWCWILMMIWDEMIDTLLSCWLLYFPFIIMPLKSARA